MSPKTIWNGLVVAIMCPDEQSKERTTIKRNVCNMTSFYRRVDLLEWMLVLQYYYLTSAGNTVRTLTSMNIVH